MSKTIAVAVLGGLLVACDQATAPVAPPTSNEGAVAVVAPGTPVYTARGTAVDATLLSLNNKISDCNLPPGPGGNIAKNVASYSAPGIFYKLLYCNAIGGSGRSVAEAGVFEVILTVGGHTIFADVLSSMAKADCPPTGPASYGSSSIARLNVDGTGHRVGTAPNYVIPLPNGYIVVNEQTSFATPFHAGRTVTALRIVINKPIAIADIKIARSQTHIDCPAV
jgi:hypothetical protein